MKNTISIVIPAKNEGRTVGELVRKLRERFSHAELIVVNDGSTDDTAEQAIAAGAKVVSHPRSQGNGAAIKTGARAAVGDVLIFMDADGQHQPADLERLLEKHAKGFDMVVGARDSAGHANIFRRVANSLYNTIASAIVGHRIYDLTSGMRVATAKQFREILPLLPNGFSYPTTSTMAFFRLGYSVGYVPVHVQRRDGKSHIRLLHDGFRFLLIIVKIGTLYSPLKMFVPLSAFCFLSGIAYYTYTYLDDGRFTNMGLFLFTSSIVLFLFGLLSEQITTLVYTTGINRRRDDE